VIGEYVISACERWHGGQFQCRCGVRLIFHCPGGAVLSSPMPEVREQHYKEGGV
jgi:hypothetical protein